MVHGGHEGLGGNGLKNSALRVDPVDALADLEGVGKTVGGNGGHLGGESGLQLILNIILEKSGIGVDDGFGVSRTVGVEGVPGLRVRGVAVLVGILEGVALSGEVLLGFLIVGAGALLGVPESFEFVSLGSLDRLVARNDQEPVVSVGVIAPQNRRRGIGSDFGDGVVAALGSGREHNAGFEKLCLGDGHEGKSFGNGLGFLCSLVSGIELAENLLVDFVGDLSMGLSRVRIGNNTACLLGIAAGRE